MDEVGGGIVSAGQTPVSRARLAEVPGPIGRGFLAFAFLALAEYWIAPPLLGVTNYAGIWSELGLPLFLLFAGSILAFVVWPLRHWLRAALGTPRRWALFAALWAGAVVAGLLAMHSLQVGEGASGVYAAYTTTYGPFGQWTGLAFEIGALSLSGVLVPVDVITLGLLGMLWSSLVVITLQTRSAACAIRPTDQPAGWRGQLLAAAVWGPLGFLSSCSACSPAYLAAIGLVAPGLAANGYSMLPLVPWIGFAGLLYLVSYGLVIVQLRRRTAAASRASQDLAWGAAL